MIYFITARDIGRVKIGYSANPSKRLSNLQTGSPVPLDLVGVCEGIEADEAALHARFSEHRLGGEWFTLAPEVAAHIASLPAIPAPDPARPPKGALAAWIAEQGMSMAEFAEMVGTTQATISRFCTAKRFPRVEMLAAITEATEGQVDANAILRDHMAKSGLAA